MAVRKIARMGHPVLRQVARPVPKSDIRSADTQRLIADMVETMFEYDGRGLAAPQVHESVQIFVMFWDFEPEKASEVRCFINPQIKMLTQEKSSCWEGCLSVPGLRGKVSRANHIQFEALDPKGERVSFEAKGFLATVIQHEYDHLVGRLYVDLIEDKFNFAFEREYEKFLSPEENSEPSEAINSV